jgi:hypothetical protein
MVFVAVKPFFFQNNCGHAEPGLPDGIFLHQKSQFGYILEVHGMENVSTFNGHL